MIIELSYCFIYKYCADLFIFAKHINVIEIQAKRFSLLLGLPVYLPATINILNGGRGAHR